MLSQLGMVKSPPSLRLFTQVWAKLFRFKFENLSVAFVEYIQNYYCSFFFALLLLSIAQLFFCGLAFSSPPFFLFKFSAYSSTCDIHFYTFFFCFFFLSQVLESCLLACLCIICRVQC